GPALRRPDVVAQFLAIMRRLPVLPRLLRPLQAALIDAGVALVPADIRERIGLGRRPLPAWQRHLVCTAGRAADRLVLRSNPAVQACRRLGRPDDYLY
ncbi:MAG TPA: hypothetical protein VF606_04160, partial [Geminicoccaceae bacterium]